ncbi:transglycosylase domain-containing protein [Janibacter cremeus]|uniref:transglycosylase domain-containing protein n=1 Tax=Janibacter cremeus TaxID=1285192 RepID=UPI0023F83388|nr:transglycosylase domain-containing protein [Janibacter cremeus]WEV76827.1 transglycosylase domain-containing protein [Janibacter cremeus]
MSASRMPHLARLLGAFVAVSVGIGLVGAGLVIPFAGASGNAAKATAQGFNNLDDEFTANPLAQQSKIFSADDKLLATPYDANRIVVPLEKIAPVMRKAQLAIEDSRFYEHGGIDVRGTSRALVSNLTSQSTQGGSSITQQYVKMMLVEKAARNDNREAVAAATEQTYARKLQELKYALNVEKTHTKKQILGSYLNLAYYGDQAYGVEAASLHFFSKNAKDLGLSEAATLAGVVQSPSRLNARTNTEEVQKRRDVVIDRMVELGWATQEEGEKAKAKDLEDLLKIRQNEGGTCSKAVDPYFCNYVIAYLKQMPELGPNPDARMQTVNTAGLKIKTTLRRDWQKELKEDLTDKVPNGDDKFGAAGAVVEPGTGKVRAIAQTSEYKVGMEQATTRYSEQAWTVPAQYGGTNGFAIGSTAKMYALVAALEKGMPMSATVDAPSAGISNPHQFSPDQFQDNCSTSAPTWAVSNDYQIGGELTLAEMTAKSINTAFAQLAADIGSCSIPKVMAKMGLTDGYGLPYGLAQSGGEKIKGKYAISNIVLGSDSTSPLQLASSYATLAAGGKYCPPTPIQSITRADGTKMKIEKPKCKKVLDRGVARGVTELLRGTLEDGGTAAGQKLDGGREAAGKTGTTDNHKQSWFAGYTPQLSTAIWVGSPITEFEMDNVTIGGQYYENVFGSTLAAPIWNNIMNVASKGMKEKDFPEPGKKIVKGDLRDIPDVVGEGPTQARAALEKAGFKVTEGSTVASNQQAGAVAYTDPREEALKGSTVTMYISSGVPPYTPPPPPPEPTTAAPPAPTPAPAPEPAPTSTPTSTSQALGQGNNGNGNGGGPSSTGSPN